MGRIVHLLLILFIATSCFSPKKQSEEDIKEHLRVERDASASFYQSSEVSGSAIDDPKEINPHWSIPQARKYRFQVCLSDRLTNQSIRNQKFTVITDVSNGKGLLAQTNDQGCLLWEETIPFNYFAKKYQYLTLHRQISGSGLQRGTRNLHIAINPWKESRKDHLKEIVDLSFWSLPEEMITPPDEVDLFLQLSQKNVLPIEVRNLGVEIRENQVGKDGLEIDLSLNFTPQIVATNLRGERIIIPILKGKFDIYAQIIGTTTRNNEETILPVTLPLRSLNNSLHQVNTYRFVDDKIDVNFKTLLQYKLEHGHHELFLNIVPRYISGAASFQGIYRIGESERILGSHGGIRPRLNSVDHPEEIAKNSKSIERMLKRSGLFSELHQDIHNLSPYYFSPLNIRFLRVLPDETTLDRTLAFVNRVCVSRMLDGRTIRMEEFQILRDDGTTVTSNTEYHGCLTWIDTITHEYYQTERLMEKTYRIRHRRGHETKLTAYINPWDYSWTFGKDIRELTPEYVQRVNNRDVAPSQLFMAGYRYQTNDFGYDIDQFLNLVVRKPVLLELAPKVLRYNSITRGRNAVEQLRDGVYMLKVAIQKDYYDPRTTGLNLKRIEGVNERIMIEAAHNKEVEFITAVQKLVRVKDGQIITPIEFTIKDLRLMRIRSNFLVQLTPIDERALGIMTHTSEMELTPEGILAQIDDLTEKERKNSRLLENIHFDVKEGLHDHEVNEEFLGSPSIHLPHDKIRDLGFIGDIEHSIIKRRENIQKLQRIIREDAGLKSRTFVGPIIMLANYFGAGVRPTDELTEVTCLTIDCDFEKIDAEIPNYEVHPEEAKYYGSAKHLSNITVTDLIERMDQIDIEYINQQTYESLVTRYLDSYVLDFYRFNQRTPSDTILKYVNPETLEYLKTLNGDERYRFTQAAQATCDSIFFRDCLISQNEAMRLTNGRAGWDNYSQIQDLNNMLSYFNLERLKENWKIMDQTHPEFFENRREDHRHGGYRDPLPPHYQDLRYVNATKPWDKNNLFDFLISQKNPDINGRYLFSYKDALNREVQYSPHRQLARRMCYFWIYYMFGERNGLHPNDFQVRSEEGRLVYSRPELAERFVTAFNRCISDATSNFDSVFLTIERWLPDKVTDLKFYGGKSMNFNVGNNVGFKYGESLSTALKSTLSFPIGQLLRLLGLAATPTGVGTKKGAVVATVGGAFGLSASNTGEESRSLGNATTISSGTFLAMQWANFDLEFDSYERCFEIRMNPDYLEARSEMHRAIMQVHEAHRLNAITRGLFICSGIKESGEGEVHPENYYYFTQHFTQGDMLDDADLPNHPWLLSIRGKRDYFHFVSLLQAAPLDNIRSLDFDQRWLPDHILNQGLRHTLENGDAVINIPQERLIAVDPIEQMVKAYHLVPPTFPGMYSPVPPKRNYPENRNLGN